MYKLSLYKYILVKFCMNLKVIFFLSYANTLCSLKENF